MPTKNWCTTEHCPREAAGPRSTLCKPCYAGLYYWQHKGVAAVMRRKGQLRILAARLEDLRPMNVIEIRARRRA